MRGFWFGKKAVAKSRHRAVCDQRRRRVDNSVTNIPNRLTNNNYCKCCFRRVGFFSSCPECNFPDSFICLEWRISLVRIKWEFFLKQDRYCFIQLFWHTFHLSFPQKIRNSRFSKFSSDKAGLFRWNSLCTRIRIFYTLFYIFYIFYQGMSEVSKQAMIIAAHLLLQYKA